MANPNESRKGGDEDSGRNNREHAAMQMVLAFVVKINERKTNLHGQKFVAKCLSRLFLSLSIT